MRNTRDMIREFNLAFGRPVNETFQHDLSPEDRLLLGKLLFEETVETITKGLGLVIVSTSNHNGLIVADSENDTLSVAMGTYDPGIDPVEIVDGCSDVNVVNHFMAHWIGFNLDRATEIVNDSNMSKLDPMTGEAIINGVTPGYMSAEAVLEVEQAKRPGENIGVTADSGYDPNKPIGKILKGPDFFDPHLELLNMIHKGDNR